MRSGSHFKGMIGEFRAWDHARTGERIKDETESDLTGTESGLVVLQEFKEGSGAVLSDSGPRNIRGAINGAAWGAVTFAPPS